MFNLFLESQIYVLFMIFIMISIGIIKEYNLFGEIYAWISNKTKSKRLTLFFISLFGGILPIPGRVAVSANMIYSLVPNCNTRECKKSKSKLGIIDYISTHHYYLWSPLEKTIIIPMVALGLSYSAMMSYLWPLLTITVIFIFWYLFIKIKETDIEINLIDYETFSTVKLLKNILPFFLAIILLIIGFEAWKVFCSLTVYYILLTKEYNFKKILSFVNWKFIFLLSIIAFLGKLAGTFDKQITEIIKTAVVIDASLGMQLFIGTSLVFCATLLLGSSSKFAGWVAIMVLIFGPQYLVWFFVVEFFAYNFSPTHKCIVVGTSLFETPIRRYLEIIGIWQISLLMYAILYTFIF
jgi:hypothetical protein